MKLEVIASTTPKTLYLFLPEGVATNTLTMHQRPHEQNGQRQQNKQYVFRIWPHLIVVEVFCPDISFARFFSSVSALAGTTPTCRQRKPMDFRNLRTRVSLRSIPVSSLIFVASSEMEDGGFSVKYFSKLSLYATN